MLLTRLELRGLKSFADKAVLDLRNNIIGIVGPNGSGKSNITDSVRWLLGERDARNLRGAKGEDLIFAGTEHRSRMGLAEASLYFDNSSGFFPVEFKEVAITRRISRDGTSQFYINDSEVRLKDLIDFLARVKLGARGLTVINQGQSDTFIAASATERREMIEETLGLKEYQLKKADAERKLKSTAYNLEKVEALLAELKPHLRLLRKQSSRYENRERISEELFELENLSYGSRLMRLRDELKKFGGEEEKLHDAIAKEEPVLHSVQKELKSMSNSEPEAAEALKRIQAENREILAKKVEFERTLGRLEARMEIQAEETLGEEAEIKHALKEIRNIGEALTAETDIGRLHAMAKEVITIVDALFAPQRKGGEAVREPAKKEYEKTVSDISSLDKRLEALRKEEEERQGMLEGFNKTFKDAYERAEEARRKHEALITEKNRVELGKERVTLKLENLKEELGQIGRSIVSLEEEVTRGNISADTLVDEDVAMRKMFKLRQELASIGEIDESIVKEARETEERNAFLIKQVEDLKQAIGDLTALIRELDEKIYTEFNSAIKAINAEFTKMIHGMFGGGKAKLVVKNGERAKAPETGDEEGGQKATENESEEARRDSVGVDIDIALPKKKIKGLDALSGGERSLVSIAALFALISVSPPPFLVLDEIDAALDEKNAQRFGEILKEFSKRTQFIVVTHNRATMEAAEALYGVTMSGDGTSKLVSLKLES